MVSLSGQSCWTREQDCSLHALSSEKRVFSTNCPSFLRILIVQQRLDAPHQGWGKVVGGIERIEKGVIVGVCGLWPVAEPR